MLYVRRGFGDEKSQLNELNRRLDQYMSRVRQLETENHHLVEEVNRLRLERGAEWVQVYHPEICELRKRVEELTIQKCEAELQRDNFLQDLQELQELWEQVRSIRLKIDQQLAQYKQDLQQARTSQAGLEKLYIQLQQECQMLEGSHENKIIALRDQALQMPLQITMQEVLRPKLSLTDVQSFSLELSESWQDAFVYYQKKIEELENILKLSEVDRHGAEEEVRTYRQQAKKVHKEYDELLAIRTMLEDELLRMKEKFSIEVEEYQIIIENLETEKSTITVNISQRLKDYYDLMQVKTGLSLEVAAYRALLEAESKEGGIIITEHVVSDRPAGYVTSTLEETTRFSNRGQEKFKYPITKTKNEVRWKADSDRLLTRTVPQTLISPRYTSLANTRSSSGSHSYETSSKERSGRWDTSLSTRYNASHKPVATPSVPYQKVQTTTMSPYASLQSTQVSQTIQKEQIQEQKPVARPRSHSRESRRGQVDHRVENKQQESDSLNIFAGKIIKDERSELQTERETKNVMEGNVDMTANETRKKYDETVSVTESVQKETLQDHKTQELPVKKERKKREEAKKRKEEQENIALGDKNVTGGIRMEVRETTQVVKTTVLDSKANDQPAVYEIPIKFEQKEEHQPKNLSHEYANQETTSKKNTEESGKATQEYREENISVDDYLKQLGQSPVFDKNETNIFLEESSQGSKYMNTFVFGEKSKEPQVVTEIPIQLEKDRKETSSHKDIFEDSMQSRALEYRNKMNINEEKSLPVDKKDKLQKDFTTNEFSGAEEYSHISSDTFEKKALVTDILQQLGHPSGLDDTNVTYIERKENCSDGSVKTEILVESKTEEEIDLFNEPDLTDLWNTTSYSSSKKSEEAKIPAEEVQSRKIKKTILEDITGAEAEEWIGSVIHTGLKGSPGKSVNVEIVEESIGAFAYEKGEYSTPFHVEEVEDTYNKAESINIEETPASARTDQIEDNSQIPVKVEEIIEGEHVGDEIDYFVSIPDDYPYIQDEEEETIKGQIYTEEESHVTYSWQDEFLQGSQGRKSLSEVLKQAVATEQSSENYSNTSDKEEEKQTAYVETVLFGKTNTYESSVDREDELETQQQKEDTETIGIAKASRYGSSVDSSDSFDLKKKEEEIHVKIPENEKASRYGSLMDNIQRYDTKEDLGESHVETIVIENKIKASPEMQSSLITLLSKDIKNPQEKLRGALDCLQGSLPDELIEELSALAGEEQTQTSSLAVDIKKIGQTDKSDTVTIVAEINVSKTLDRDNIDDLDLNKIIEKEEIHRQYQKVSSEDAISVQQKEGTTEISFEPDLRRFIKQITLDTQEHMFQEESASAWSSTASLSPTETNRTEHHIKLSPKEPLYNKQIIFEGPISETLKLDFGKNTEETSEQNRSIRHIKISPTENVPTEQIIFQGPLLKTVGMDGKGELSVQEKHAERVFEKVQVGSPETTSHSIEVHAGSSKAVSHFKVNSGEYFNKQVVVEGSIPISHDFSRASILKNYNIEDDSCPIEHNSATHKIHVAKQVKYQGFVSEPHTVEDYGDITQRNDQANVNTSVHHIKLSPSNEQIVFEGPLSTNFHISGEDKTYMEDINRPIRHIRLGSPDAHTLEHVTFEGPTTESYESSDFFVSSPSGESTESERSFKHIKLGPKEKTFTFQMDITKIATKHSEDKGAKDSGMVITSTKFEGQPEVSQSSTALLDDSEVAESGYGEEEVAGVSQFAYEILPQSQNISEISELEKTVQIQRIVHPSDMVSEEKRVAIVYLGDEEEEDEDADQDYLRRSF